MKRTLLAALAGYLLTSCGYHIAGKADLLPAELHTIAIPAFENVTTRYRLTQQMAGAITREFRSRTRYRIVANPEEAEAVLHGTVVNFMAYPTIFDSQTGRSTGMQIFVVLDLRLQERATGKMLYRNSAMTLQQRYETSTDQSAYFEESDQALARLSENMARTVVSAILESF